MSTSGSLRGNLSIDERLALISVAETLNECVKGAIHIQECVFEDLNLKQQIFKQIDDALEQEDTEVAICSSSSVQLPSAISALVVKHKSQCFNAHPINPPTLVRLVELIPHSETRADLVARTRSLMDEVGQKPVLVGKEIIGFALNRIQFAVLQEAFRLVNDGVMSPEDVDTVVSEGLGPRYAFMGPWMTIHLNANGMADYMARYGEGVNNVNKECQPLLLIEGKSVNDIADSMNKQVPIDKLNEKRLWRDECLTRLSGIKSALGDGQPK